VLRWASGSEWWWQSALGLSCGPGWRRGLWSESRFWSRSALGSLPLADGTEVGVGIGPESARQLESALSMGSRECHTIQILFDIEKSER